MHAAAAALLLVAGHARGDDASAFWLETRLRYEHVEEQGFASDAEALTLRTRLGWRSARYAGLRLVLEAEDVRAPVDDYNSTANGRTHFPVVADPAGSEWNQAFVEWQRWPAHRLTLGRQRIALENQRHVGNVGWRQNEQTFDAFGYAGKLGARTELSYHRLEKVHRVFGNEHPDPLAAERELDGHLLHVAWAVPRGRLATFGYLVEDQDVPAASTRTLGLRYAGRCVSWSSDWQLSCTGEVARQRAWRHALAGDATGYSSAELALQRGGHTLRFGRERLGGNGQRAFQTPLATLHAFNGWTDRFLTTPADGLVDRHVKLDGSFAGLRYALAWHDFDADRGGRDYGREWGAQLGRKFGTRTTLSAKAAFYDADGFSVDTRKFWLTLEYAYP